MRLNESIGKRRQVQASRKNRSAMIRLEELEPRLLLTGAATPNPNWFTPAQIRGAYGFDQIPSSIQNGQAIPADGRGQTIAIIDLGDNPNVQTDLKRRRSKSFRSRVGASEGSGPRGRYSASRRAASCHLAVVRLALLVGAAVADIPMPVIVPVTAGSLRQHPTEGWASGPGEGCQARGRCGSLRLQDDAQERVGQLGVAEQPLPVQFGPPLHPSHGIARPDHPSYALILRTSTLSSRGSRGDAIMHETIMRPRAAEAGWFATLPSLLRSPVHRDEAAAAGLRLELLRPALVW
jgi:hypothetical protein